MPWCLYHDMRPPFMRPDTHFLWRYNNKWHLVSASKTLAMKWKPQIAFMETGHGEFWGALADVCSENIRRRKIHCSKTSFLKIEIETKGSRSSHKGKKPRILYHHLNETTAPQLVCGAYSPGVICRVLGSCGLSPIHDRKCTLWEK